jgi:hypothetical protein
MRRKSLLIVAGIAILTVGAILTALALLARHEPHFWREAAVAPGKVRQDQSKKFVSQFVSTVNAIIDRRAEWQASFSEAQINSFFEEDFLSPGYADKLLPDNVTQPRVVLQQDKIRLAFRYGKPPWSTVISIDFRVWLAPKECNVVVLELQSLHAGSLPISAHSLLEQLSEIIRKRNIDVTWYRHNGNPAAVLRFQTDQPRPTVQLLQLQLGNGMLRLAGRSLESVPSTASAPAGAPRGN